MYYADLTNTCPIASGPRVRAVGWLASDHEFPRGEVDLGVVESLARLRDDGWVHVASAGPHACELCQRERESRNILVPAQSVVYVAPAMIVHYMADHAYRPPAEFSEAVLASPEPLTDAYYAALRRFVDVFSFGRTMSVDDFDRYAAEHRKQYARIAADGLAEAGRRGFTWD